MKRKYIRIPAVICLLCLIISIFTFLITGNLFKVKAYGSELVEEHDNTEQIYNVASPSEETGVHYHRIGEEFPYDYGCSTDSCGSGREYGYSAGYMERGCRNWMGMPWYVPTVQKYWIDESTLADINETDPITNINPKGVFIQNIEDAAAVWNSTRMYDSAGPIVNLIRVFANGADVCKIEYDNTLVGKPGDFYPVPNHRRIRIRNHEDLPTMQHEFGHLLGLQDLDRKNNSYDHDVLMGYNGFDMCYQDIQGLAVVTRKEGRVQNPHVHDYRRYVEDGEYYHHFCFYCDLMNTQLVPLPECLPMEETEECTHDYQPIVSAGDRHWLKCDKCCKVVETELLNGEYVEEDGGFHYKYIPSSNSYAVMSRANLITGIPGMFQDRPVTSIGNNAFYNDTSITSLIIPNNIISIGNDAFYGCTSLTNVTIPQSVTSVGSNVFQNCTSLSITWEYNPEITAANFRQYLKTVYIPNTVQYIGINAFKDCTGLTNITIPASVTVIGSGAFSGCTNLVEFTVDSGNTNFIAIEGVLYSKSPNGNMGAELVAYPAGKAAESFTIPEGVTVIAPYTFFGCTNLEEVILPVDRFIYCGYNSFDLNSGLDIIMPYDLRPQYEANADWNIYISNFETTVSEVFFNSNGGSAVLSRTVFYGERVELSSPYMQGFTFAGWYDDNGYCYYINTLWNSLDETVTLYAAWANRTYTVDLGGTQVTYEILYTTYNVKMPGFKIPTQQACDYIGYNINGGGEIPYYFENGSGAELWNLNNAVLYEDWRLTIYFYSEDGIVEAYKDIEPQTFIYYAPSIIPERAGFTFAGWYSEPHGSGTEFHEFIAYFDMVFYAKWEAAVNFSVTNGEDLILNYSNAPAGVHRFTYIINGGSTLYTVHVSLGTHSLIGNLTSSSNYNSPKNITIAFKTIYVNKSGIEIAYSLENISSVTFHNLFAGGSGTANDPYTINSGRHLKNISKSLSSNYRLLNNITLSGQWTPLNTFSGVLDGNGKSISMIRITTGIAGSYGLFKTNAGTIKNLEVSAAIDINIRGNSDTVYAGAFAGQNSGFITDCTAYGHYGSTVYNPPEHIISYVKNSYTGGIAGYNTGLINGCTNRSILSGFGNIGGIAGYSYGGIENSTNYGYITYGSIVESTNDNKSIGGIAGEYHYTVDPGGYYSRGFIRNCKSFGNIAYVGYVIYEESTGTDFDFSDDTKSNSKLKPHMGQLIGYCIGTPWTVNGNTILCTVDISQLLPPQSKYAEDRPIGRQ